MLRNFITLKKSITLARFQSVNLGSNGKHANHYTTEATQRYLLCPSLGQSITALTMEAVSTSETLDNFYESTQHNVPEGYNPYLQLLLQYICNYTPYLQHASQVCSVRKHHASMTKNPLNMVASITCYLSVNDT
jgi:hypothetical protein